MVMPYHDLVTDLQSQSCPLTHVLRREERIEDQPLDGIWDTGAVVHHLDQHVLGLARGTHGDSTATIYGIEGVVEQVRPNLVKLAPISSYPRQRRIVLANDFDATA